MTERPVLRVGIAGAGFLAATRVRCWRRVFGIDVRLIAVAAQSEDSARRFATTHDVGAPVVGWRELVERQDIDLVDVCLPNDVHRAAVVDAAAAGKAVICTKPLAAYVGQDLDDGATDADISGRDRREMAAVAIADARAMVAAAERAGVPLMYGENWIYAPAIVRAATLLERTRGSLLEMRGEEAHSGSHAPYASLWRHAGGGALLRLAAHPIGAMLHLKRLEGRRRGTGPIHVSAVTAEVTDPLRGADMPGPHLAAGPRDVEAWGCVVLHFEDGSRGVAFGSDLALGGMESQLELRASDARFVCRMSPHDQLSAYAPDEQTFGDAYLMEKLSGRSGWSTPLPDEDWSSGQQGMVQAFAEAAARGESPAADGELGLDVTRVLYGAYVAAAEARRVEMVEVD